MNFFFFKKDAIICIGEGLSEDQEKYNIYYNIDWYFT